MLIVAIERNSALVAQLPGTTDSRHERLSLASVDWMSEHLDSLQGCEYASSTVGRAVVHYDQVGLHPKRPPDHVGEGPGVVVRRNDNAGLHTRPQRNSRVDMGRPDRLSRPV